MYGVDDLYRIKDIVHSVDKNHWESKKWLADKLFELYGHDAGKFYIAGGWYGMMAYQLRQKWPGEQMNIVSADCDPMCEEYAWKLFDGYDISFKTADVNTEEDFSEYSAIINTSCEHIENFTEWNDKIPNGKLVVLQSNNYYEVEEHVNCVRSIEEFGNMARMTGPLYAGELELPKYKRFMLIGYK